MDREQFQRETQIHNEQVKLLASCLNIMAAGFAVTGIVGPFTTVGMRIVPGSTIDGQALALTFVWIASGVTLHLIGSLMLRNLR